MTTPLLALTGLAMGLAASPHCIAMCSAPCAAAAGPGARRQALWHAGRIAGYMAGGAVAAGSVAALGGWMQAAPALKPLWSLVHLALLALGLWWLFTGRAMVWHRTPEQATVAVPFFGRRSGCGAATKPAAAAAAGLAWVAWPCGVLQAALALSALADGAWGGALVMGAFALGSLPALSAAPWLWQRWMRRSRRKDYLGAAWQYRLAGLGLVAGSGWALGHGLWIRLQGVCVA